MGQPGTRGCPQVVESEDLCERHNEMQTVATNNQQEAAGWRSLVEWQKTNAFLHTVTDKLVTAQFIIGRQ